MAAPIPRLMVVNTFPPPGPPSQVVSYSVWVHLSRLWRCDACGATGTGNPDDGFAYAEAEHCLTGCNGSLRAVVPRSGVTIPPLPEPDQSLNGMPIRK